MRMKLRKYTLPPTPPTSEGFIIQHKSKSSFCYPIICTGSMMKSALQFVLIVVLLLNILQVPIVSAIPDFIRDLQVEVVPGNRTTTLTSTSTDRCRDKTTYDFKPCTSWTQFMNHIVAPLESIYIYPTRIIIPCGVCVEIQNTADNDNDNDNDDDNDADTTNSLNLIFNDGIDIQGMLRIDCNSSPQQQQQGYTNSQWSTIVIQTTMMVVQGRLEINASCKPVDGIPFIVFYMIGKNIPVIGTNSTFVPIHNSIQPHCISNNNTSTGNTNPCNVGEKGITIAGGQVDIIGIPEDTPSWLNLYDVTYTPGEINPTGIIVSSTIKNKWNVGSTILITSFTSHWNQYQQVRTITSISDVIGGGVGGEGRLLVQLGLNTPIVRPTTLLDSPHYAVEVALLSKNIIFTSELSGTNNTVGGHFWFFYTSNVNQKIVGVDIQNFGQQGRLGRYPIHFHHCSNNAGTLISKNTIRQSFQRCIVIHGTNNVTIQKNVAYDTAGHCFMLEDGIEIGNKFIANLGVMTRKPLQLIPSIDSAKNGIETDDLASTFWITNPMNTYIGNVAGGSEDSGFWFELLKRGIYQDMYPELDPQTDSLAMFRDNVAHSNEVKGFRTYPLGFFPGNTARFSGMKSYRNAGTGLFLHISSNLQIEDSLFADNGLAIDLERTLSPPMQFSNVTIIGETMSFRTNVRDKGLDTVCGSQYDANQGRNIGVEIRTWKNEVGSAGAIWDNVKFSGFNHGSCTYASPISMDYTIRDGHLMFDYYTTMKSMAFGDAIDFPIDLCRAQNDNVFDIYLSDIDGSLRPRNLASVVSPSTILSLQPNMKQFILDSSKCTDIPSKCLSYCQDTCFRGLLFEVDPSFSQNYSLRICQTINPSNCILVPGYRRSADPYYSHRYRYFPAYTPIGEYIAVFVDESGVDAWPSFVRQIPTDFACPKSGYHSVKLKEPTVTPGHCIELIRNGNAEASTTLPNFWLTQGLGFGHLQLLSGAGVSGSNALSGIYNNTRTIFVQFLDTRCLKLMVNAVYRVSADVKLLSDDGATYICDPRSERCPEIGIFTEQDGFMNENGYEMKQNTYQTSFLDARLEYIEKTTSNPTLGEYDYVDGTYTVIAAQSVSVSERMDMEGYRTLQGELTITKDLLKKDGIRFYVQSFKHRLLVDNVSMILINGIQAATCPNLIENSDMENGYKGYWSSRGFGDIETVTPGYNNSPTALLYRKQVFLGQAGPIYIVSEDKISNCFTSSTSNLKVTVQVRLIRRMSGNAGARCNVTRTCPAVRIQIFDKQDRIFFSTAIRSYVTTTWNPDGFNAFEAVIDLPNSDTMLQNAGQITIGFVDFSWRWELIWDDFLVVPT